jgi:hypothetical protein
MHICLHIFVHVAVGKTRPISEAMLTQCLDLPIARYRYHKQTPTICAETKRKYTLLEEIETGARQISNYLGLCVDQLMKAREMGIVCVFDSESKLLRVYNRQIFLVL